MVIVEHFAFVTDFFKMRIIFKLQLISLARCIAQTLVVFKKEMILSQTKILLHIYKIRV